MASESFMLSVGDFIIAQTSYCQRDGWYEQVCKYVGKGEYPGRKLGYKINKLL